MGNLRMGAMCVYVQMYLEMINPWIKTLYIWSSGLLQCRLTIAEDNLEKKSSCPCPYDGNQ